MHSDKAKTRLSLVIIIIIFIIFIVVVVVSLFWHSHDGIPVAQLIKYHLIRVYFWHSY